MTSSEVGLNDIVGGDGLVVRLVDSILGVFVEAVELSVGCVGELPVPLVTEI
ncbi:hypothetical protein [Haloglomus salinum]|jgi:hypothetical protein|uniref:hypothetical protein n=1 Tax=Haloglomus salinum TaxID=2962673 RepID=UPI0020C9C50D|nr:hypothetical protein [Haloglomus salinum]